jgi:hypothetical protein
VADREGGVEVAGRDRLGEGANRILAGRRHGRSMPLRPALP